MSIENENLIVNFDLPNRGKPWSIEEKQQLIEEMEKRLSTVEISKIHGRTVFAIEIKKKELLYEMNKNGKTIEELFELFGFPIKTIKEDIEFYRNRLELKATNKKTKEPGKLSKTSDDQVLISLKKISNELINLIKLIENS